MGQSISFNSEPKEKYMSSYDRQWLEYIKQWIMLDSKKYRAHMLAVVNNDLDNDAKYDHESFCKVYNPFEKKSYIFFLNPT